MRRSSPISDARSLLPPRAGGAGSSADELVVPERHRRRRCRAPRRRTAGRRARRAAARCRRAAPPTRAARRASPARVVTGLASDRRRGAGNGVAFTVSASVWRTAAAGWGKPHRPTSDIHLARSALERAPPIRRDSSGCRAPRSSLCAAMTDSEAGEARRRGAAAELVRDGQLVGLGTGQHRRLPAAGARRAAPRDPLRRDLARDRARPRGRSGSRSWPFDGDRAPRHRDRRRRPGRPAPAGSSRAAAAPTRARRSSPPPRTRFVVIVSSDKAVERIGPPIPLELLRFGLDCDARRARRARALRDAPPSPDGGADRRLPRRRSTTRPRWPRGSTRRPASSATASSRRR